MAYGELSHTCVGSVERLTISRSGDFSCPVESGVIFMGNCNIADWASRPNESTLLAFQVDTLSQAVSVS